jgi:hypothetical protein
MLKTLKTGLLIMIGQTVSQTVGQAVGQTVSHSSQSEWSVGQRFLTGYD